MENTNIQVHAQDMINVLAQQVADLSKERAVLAAQVSTLQKQLQKPSDGVSEA